MTRAPRHRSALAGRPVAILLLTLSTMSGCAPGGKSLEQSCETVRKAAARVAQAADVVEIATIAAELYREVAAEGDAETRELFEPAIAGWDRLAAGQKHNEASYKAVMAVDRACQAVRDGE